MKFTFKYHGDVKKIFEYIEKSCTKNTIIKMDPDDLLGEIDLIFDTMKISSLNFFEGDDKICTFTCTYQVARNILKFIYCLKTLGDCGHSFEIKINNKSFGWDGDGSDRIFEINGMDCKHVKDMTNNFYKYIKIEEDLSREYIIETLN